jgi:hypothetical protein
MTNGANYKRGKLHHSPWHSDIRTSHQLNKVERRDCIKKDYIRKDVPGPPIFHAAKIVYLYESTDLFRD